jgi:amino acid adenylation domain-containing protein
VAHKRTAIASKGKSHPGQSSKVVMNNSESTVESVLSEQKRELLARLLGEESVPTQKPITRRGGNQAPLSFAQQRLWFLDQMSPDAGVAYNNCLHSRVRGELDIAILEKALNEVIARHEVMRTTFQVLDSVPTQIISPSLRLPINVVDLSHLQEAVRDSAARRHCLEEEAIRFDLAKGPLLRVTVLRLSPEEHVLILCIHHIISDGWTIGVLQDEITALYAAFSAGQPSPLKGLAIQYSDYTHWQNEWLQGSVLQEQISYWRKQLQGAPAALELPTDRPRPAVQTVRGGRYMKKFSRGFSAALNAFNRREGVTMFMTLLSAFEIVLARHSGQRDIIIGTPIAGRTRIETEPLLGLFLNTLALRADLSSNPTVRELLHQTRETALQAYAHQDVPFEKLVEELQPQRDLSRSPFFQVMFILQNSPPGNSKMRGLSVELFDVSTHFSKFELTLLCLEDEDGITAAFEYNSDLYELSTMQGMAQHLQSVLEEMMSRPDAKALELELMDEAERKLLLGWNNTDREWTEPRCLPQLIEAQVGRTPTRVAATFEESSLAYAQLNSKANQLANFLRSKGVGPDALIGIAVERSLDMLVATLAVLKAGGAYLPLDPEYPPERIAFMLEDSGASVLVTQEDLLSRLPAHTNIVCLDRDAKAIDECSAENLPSSVDPDNLAYVIYTSGSTGKPKGVMIPHRALVNFLLSVREVPGLSADDVLLAVTTLSFDIAGLELYLPLIVGARVDIASRQVASDPGLLAERLTTTGATVMQATPATWRMLMESGYPGNPTLKVLCGGEAFPPDLANQLVERCGQVWNMYGPTETTIWSVLAPVEAGETIVPIGRPLANTQIYILDAELQLVPVGVPGDLYIGGEGLARGYLNRPELTAERFIANPFANGSRRIYKTGDLARCRADGTIECLGRVDNQVKLRGYRLELGEIETTLNQHPHVKDSVVIVREDVSGDKRLVAYFISALDPAPQPAELRAHLSKRLPDYMLPSVFMELTSFPLTPNGKVDRRALPAPERARADVEARFVAPRTSVEESLAAIWAEILGLEKVGINDSFFELGGHSLLLTRVQNELQRKINVFVPVIEFFRYPTVSTLAAFIENAGKPESSPLPQARDRADLRRNSLQRLAASSGLIYKPDFEVMHKDMAPATQPRADHPSSDDLLARKRALLAQLLEDEGIAERDAIPLRADSGPAPLSSGQQRLWFLDRLQQGSAAYKVQGSLPLLGPLNVEALRRSIEMVVRRHASLRTTFLSIDGVPMQVVHESGTVDLPFVDISIYENEQLRQEHADRILLDYATKPLNLGSGPVFHLQLVKISPECHELMIGLHHIVSDAWSMQIFIREMVEHYEAYNRGEEPNPAPLPIQYADFASWQRDRLQGKELEQQLEYWRKQLGGTLTPLELPRDHGRPRTQHFRMGRESLHLSPKLVEGLNALSRQGRVTLFMTMLSLFQVLLARLTGNEDVLVGTPLSGRNRVETEALIGFFIQTLVLRTNLSGNPSFEQLLDQVREVVLAAQAHQDIPFEQIVEALHPQRDLTRPPIFQVFFDMINIPPQETTNSSGLRVEKVEGLEAESEFDLTAYVIESRDGILLHFLYNADLFEASRVAEMLRQYNSILEQVVEVPTRPVWSLSLVTPETKPILPDPTSAIAAEDVVAVHERFSEIAERFSRKVALSDAQESWTYGELDEWSNKLAHHLRSAGIGSGDAVAIYASRSAALMCAVLSVLKAGAAFVILDPAYPAQHVEACLRAARAKAWIQPSSVKTPIALAEALSELPSLISVELPSRSAHDSCSWLKNSPSAPPTSSTDPDSVAYIAFTSGSTGRPKGIVGTHRPLAHFMRWHTETFSLTHSDRFSMLSGVSHDPALRDIFAPLWVGASLHIPGDEQRQAQLARWLHQEQITVSHITPPIAELLSEGNVGKGTTALPSLHHVFFGGDALLPRHIATVRELAPSAVCVNFYGATETPQAMGSYIVPADYDQEQGLPIGKGIDGVQLLVLNRAGELAGVGELGEIHVRTPYLAKGYLENEGGVERFIPNHFTNSAGDRLFRTGDLGRYRMDGTVVCLGRADDQVKIPGFRIELAHVQARLKTHPAIKQCAVVLREDSPGEKRLIAYFVPNQNNGDDALSLREHVAATLPDYMVPSAFVALPQLPLTPNGKIDRRALPVPQIASSGTAKAAPSDEIDLAVMQVWKKVLAVDSLTIKDNFFDLGGHSLLAVRLFAEIEKVFGRSLPVATIFQAPTVERFAAVLRAEGWSAPYDALVPIKTNGSAPPFFCVHSLGANLVSYGSLAQRLSNDQPFYGLQPQGLDGKQAPHTRIEDMAAHYVSALRVVQPHGPYHLGGACLGGVIAFEMAQQLLAQGEQMAHLLLMDSDCPGTPAYLPRRTLNYGAVEQLDWYLGDLMLMPFREKAKYVFTRFKNAGMRIGQGLRGLAGRLVPAIAPESAELERVLSRVKELNTQAYQHYTPQRYAGKITMLWCSEVSTRCYRDRRLAWSEFADGGLEVHAIPGNHMTMLEPPHVEGMAATVSACLKKVQAEAVAPPSKKLVQDREISLAAAAAAST